MSKVTEFFQPIWGIKLILLGLFLSSYGLYVNIHITSKYFDISTLVLFIIAAFLSGFIYTDVRGLILAISLFNLFVFVYIASVLNLIIAIYALFPIVATYCMKFSLDLFYCDYEKHYESAVTSNNVRRLKILRLLFPFSLDRQLILSLLLNNARNKDKSIYYLIKISSSKTLLSFIEHLYRYKLRDSMNSRIDLNYFFKVLCKDKKLLGLVSKKLGKKLSNDFLYEAIRFGNKDLIEKFYDKVESPNHREILKLASTLGNEEIFEFFCLKATEGGADIGEIIDDNIFDNIIGVGNPRILDFLSSSLCLEAHPAEKIENKLLVKSNHDNTNYLADIEKFKRNFCRCFTLSSDDKQEAIVPESFKFLSKYGNYKHIIEQFFKELKEHICFASFVGEILKPIKNIHRLQIIKFYIGPSVRQFLTSEYKIYYNEEYVFINGNEGEVKPIVSEVLIGQGWPNDLTSIVCEYLTRFELKSSPPKITD